MTDYNVPCCSIKMDVNYRPHYFIDGKEVSKSEWEKMQEKEAAENKRKHRPQNGKRFQQPALHGDCHDFGRETDPTTGKNGRYYPQLARFSGDPRAVVRHVNVATELAKRRGYGVERWA